MQLAKVLAAYESISSQTGASVADIIVIGGAVGIEQLSGAKVEVTTGRGDASQENTDVSSFDLLKPGACGFRNYIEKEYSVSPEELLLDKAQLPRTFTSGTHCACRWHTRHGGFPIWGWPLGRWQTEQPVV